MEFNQFIFSQEDKLLEAKKTIEHSYPNLLVTADLNTLILQVETINSDVYDTRISSIVNRFEGAIKD